MEFDSKLVFLALASIFLSWALPVLYNLLFSPLKRVPGPFWARVSRLWEFYSVWKGHSNQDFISLHKKYGPVVRVAPNRYSFNQPQDVRTIYELGGKFIKGDFYSVLSGDDQEKTNLFILRDNDCHRDRRRKISSLYTMSAMVLYEDAVDKMTAVCIRKLYEFAKDDRVFEFPKFMQYYAFDVIGLITFNQSFDMMENEGDVTGIIDCLHKGVNYLSHIGLLPNLHRWIAWFGRLFGEDDSAQTLITYTINQIERHRKENEKPSQDTQYTTFLKKMFDLQADHKLDYFHIIDAAGNNIGAGSDTTAITLSSALYYLYKHPEKLAKLRDEIDTMASEGRLSNPATFQEAQSMPYLQAVIKESLRIHPAVGTILAREVPKGGAKLGGYFFPEGTHVGANAWVLHYDKDIYGPDADTYRPERWLEAKEDLGDQNSMMLAFGAGSRTCIGKNISLLEINKVIPQIVRTFDIVFGNDTPMETHYAWFVFTKYNVQIKLRE